MPDHFTVTKLLMTQTGTYNDFYLRPYIASTDLNSIDIVREVTGGGRNFAPSLLSGIAGNIIQPSSQGEGIVNITNGWGESRFRFLMEVEVGGPLMGNKVRYVLTGYTDYCGASTTGAVDPNLRFYFNNSILLNVVTEQTSYGRVERSRLVDASHVLHGRAADVYVNGQVIKNGLHTMRPEDIFSTINAQSLGTNMFTDLRTQLNYTPKLSRRSNGCASTYLSKALDAHRASMETADNDVDYSTVLSSAQGRVREMSLQENVPLKILRHRTSYAHEDSVTYRELMQLSPHLDDITYIQMAKQLPTPVHQQGMTEHFNGSLPETIAATILAQSVPALMMDCVLTGLMFSVTNDTFGGAPDFVVGNVQAFSDINLEPYLRAFQDRFLAEIFPDITKRGNLVVSAEISVDILGETFIRISIDSRPFIDYVIPSFADALIAPVTTVNPGSLSGLATAINNLSEQLTCDNSNIIEGYANATVGRSL